MEQEILEYVDQVMAGITAPEEWKIRLENELIRRCVANCDDAGISDITNTLGTPEEFAADIAGQTIPEIGRRLDGAFTRLARRGATAARRFGRCGPAPAPAPDYPPRGAYGQYMHEESNVNIKLLYIPLVQISAGVDRICMPITGSWDGCYCE